MQKIRALVIYHIENDKVYFFTSISFHSLFECFLKQPVTFRLFVAHDPCGTTSHRASRIVSPAKYPRNTENARTEL